jgi:hypothetical protein
MRKFLEIGGLVAAVVLIAFGAVAVVMGVHGKSTVQNSLKLEQITGSPDMTPSAITAEAKKAGLTGITFPTCSVAGLSVNSGDRARCFAQYMRIHALEATGGVPYSLLPRYATADGKGTNDTAAATKSPNGQPLDNPVRNVWVTETALTTALNTSYMASQLALFGVVVGIALLLSGIGFGVLALGGALRNPETALTFVHRGSSAVPAD